MPRISDCGRPTDSSTPPPASLGMTPSSSHRLFNPTEVLQFVIPTERAKRLFTLSSRPRERSDFSRCHPNRGSVATFHAVIPTEGASRLFTLSSRPRERRDFSRCHPDRGSVATEWRDPFDSRCSLRTSLWAGRRKRVLPTNRDAYSGVSSNIFAAAIWISVGVMSRNCVVIPHS